MLPQPPRALKTNFAPQSAAEISQRGAEESTVGTAPIDHHCQVCPTCGHTLTGHRCKLVCAHCGYYMSCADYY